MAELLFLLPALQGIREIETRQATRLHGQSIRDGEAVLVRGLVIRQGAVGHKQAALSGQLLAHRMLTVHGLCSSLILTTAGCLLCISAHLHSKKLKSQCSATDDGLLQPSAKLGRVKIG